MFAPNPTRYLPPMYMPVLTLGTTWIIVPMTITDVPKTHASLRPKKSAKYEETNEAETPPILRIAVNSPTVLPLGFPK
jgi:hypothetical protein